MLFSTINNQKYQLEQKMADLKVLFENELQMDFSDRYNARETKRQIVLQPYESTSSS
jgi:hypothetical protein